MRRRGFLAGLLALPFVAPLARAAKAVKRRLFPVVYVGAGAVGEDSAPTLAEAFKSVVPGGTIYLLPGHCENINETVAVDKPVMVFGATERAKLTWDQNS